MTFCIMTTVYSVNCFVRREVVVESNDQKCDNTEEPLSYGIHNPPPATYCSGIRRVDPVGAVSRFEPVFTSQKDDEF